MKRLREGRNSGQSLVGMKLEETTEIEMWGHQQESFEKHYQNFYLGDVWLDRDPCFLLMFQSGQGFPTTNIFNHLLGKKSKLGF